MILAQAAWAAQLSKPLEVRALFYPTSTGFDVITHLITQLRLTKIHNYRKKVIFVDDSTFPAFFSHHSDNAATPHARKKGCDDLLSYFDMCLDTSDV